MFWIRCVLKYIFLRYILFTNKTKQISLLVQEEIKVKKGCSWHYVHLWCQHQQTLRRAIYSGAFDLFLVVVALLWWWGKWAGTSWTCWLLHCFEVKNVEKEVVIKKDGSHNWQQLQKEITCQTRLNDGRQTVVQPSCWRQHSRMAVFQQTFCQARKVCLVLL